MRQVCAVHNLFYVGRCPACGPVRIRRRRKAPAAEPPEPEGEALRGGEAAAELARSQAEAQRLK